MFVDKLLNSNQSDNKFDLCIVRGRDKRVLIFIKTTRMEEVLITVTAVLFSPIQISSRKDRGKLRNTALVSL